MGHEVRYSTAWLKGSEVAEGPGEECVPSRTVARAPESPVPTHHWDEGQRSAHYPPSSCVWHGHGTRGKHPRAGLWASTSTSERCSRTRLYLESPSGAGAPSARTSLGVPAFLGFCLAFLSMWTCPETGKV